MKRVVLYFSIFLLVFGVVSFQGCKKSGDDENIDANAGVVGTWNLSITFKNNSVVKRVITFAGTAAEGKFSDDLGDSGTYRVGDVAIYFTRIAKTTGVIQYFIGIIADNNNMSGTFIGTDTGTGTWSATR